jgi:biotin transport system substrate-specific component
MTTSNPVFGHLGTRANHQRFPVLAERLWADKAGARGVARAAGLVVAVAALTALLAQLSVYIPGDPVPITGQTFAVLLAASAVGPACAVAGQLLYIAVGWAGLPVFAEGAHGWQVVHGATGGYFVGFILASAFLGWQARHGVDRRVDTLAGSFLLATALIYIPGVWWLAHSMDVSYARAVALGVAPFVIGDLLKALAAGALLPAVWRVLGRPGAPRHDN